MWWWVQIVKITFKQNRGGEKKKKEWTCKRVTLVIYELLFEKKKYAEKNVDSIYKEWLFSDDRSKLQQNTITIVIYREIMRQNNFNFVSNVIYIQNVY